jgi:hypothetical protein
VLSSTGERSKLPLDLDLDCDKGYSKQMNKLVMNVIGLRSTTGRKELSRILLELKCLA